MCLENWWVWEVFFYREITNSLYELSFIRRKLGPLIHLNLARIRITHSLCCPFVKWNWSFSQRGWWRVVGSTGMDFFFFVWWVEIVWHELIVSKILLIVFVFSTKGNCYLLLWYLSFQLHSVHMFSVGGLGCIFIFNIWWNGWLSISKYWFGAASHWFCAQMRLWQINPNYSRNTIAWGISGSNETWIFFLECNLWNIKM